MTIERVPTQLTDYTPLGVRVNILAHHVITRRDAGEQHQLVQGLQHVEEQGGALTLPELAHYRTQLPQGDEAESPLYWWTTTPTTIRRFTLPQNMRGVGKKGTSYTLIGHTSTPLGITSQQMAEAIDSNNTLPWFGIKYDPANKMGLLEDLRDNAKLLKLKDAQERGEVLRGPGYAILLTARQATQTRMGNVPNTQRKSEPFIYAALGGNTAYLNALATRFNHESFYVGGTLDTELPEGTGGAWLASLKGLSGLFVGYYDFYDDARFLVGSAGGAPARDTTSNGAKPDLDKVISAIEAENPTISGERLRPLLSPLWQE